MSDEAEKQAPAERPGIKTTEFWLALAVALGGLLAAHYAEKDWAQIAGLVAAALASMGYGYSRKGVKVGA